MERLTYSNESELINSKKAMDDFLLKCYYKLARLEDLEQDLGVGLEVIYKALKYGICITSKGLIPPQYFTKRITIEGDGFRCHTSDEYVSFKDYGKTWGLTRGVDVPWQSTPDKEVKTELSVKDITIEQARSICNYMYDKYGEIDENNIPVADTDVICKHCPFSTIYVDGTEGIDGGPTIHRLCFKGLLFQKVSDEVKDLLEGEL